MGESHERIESHSFEDVSRASLDGHCQRTAGFESPTQRVTRVRCLCFGNSSCACVCTCVHEVQECFRGKNNGGVDIQLSAQPPGAKGCCQ